MSQQLEKLTELLRTHLVPLPPGKARDSYGHPNFPQYRGVLGTDRISSHDHVLGFEMGQHGQIRNASSIHWKLKLEERHIVTDLVYYGRDIDSIMPAPLAGIPELWKRFVWVHAAQMDLVEDIGRNRLLGSAFGQYRDNNGLAYGQQLAPGLEKGALLSPPLWTPTTKAPPGHHDEPLEADDVETRYPQHRGLTLLVLGVMNEETKCLGKAEYCDSKFEFGWIRPPEYQQPFIAVCDEIGSFDSSRIRRAQDMGKADWFDRPVDKDWLRWKLEALGIKGLDPQNPEHRKQAKQLRLTSDEQEELEILSFESLRITTGLTLREFQMEVLKIPRWQVS
ncbi:MAG: phosphoribosylaminoimidazolesuccinocarboxamide synthase [Parcubacteria group bacterium]|nr:phosphoribosylaminoimidazolesuccinocarboxamide synthase [Parcubacteria group bacterium]